MKRLLTALMVLGAWSSPAGAQSGDGPRVGVVADPCAALEPMPKIVADYMVRYAEARAKNQPPPPASADGMAIYRAWQERRLMQDFPGLCRYRAENAALLPASPARVLFFGDSITEGWKDRDPGLFAGDRVNRGISGQTTQQMLGRFRADVIALEPAVVHILAGTNDIAGNTGPTSLAAIQDNIRSMVELAQAHDIRVVIGSILPAARFDWRPGVDPRASIRALNTWLKDYAAREKLTYVDYHGALRDEQDGFKASLADDGVHPNVAGYAIMRPLAERALAPR